MKYLSVVGCAVGVLLLAALLFDKLALSAAVEEAIVQRLKRHGLTEAALSVREVGPARAYLTDLALGGGRRLTIDSAVATYDTADLRAGRVQRLRLSGARLRVSITDGRVELGELARLFDRPADAGVEPLFFRRIDLRASTIVVERNGAAILRLPVRGEFRAVGADRLKVRLSIQLLNRELRCRGELKRGSDRLELRSGRVTLEPGDVPIPGTPAILRNAGAALRLAGSFHDGGGRLRILPGSTVTAESFSGSLRGVELQPRDGTAEEPWLRLAVAGEPTVLGFRAPGGEAGATWSADGPGLRLRLRRTDVSVPERGVRLNGLHGTAAFAGRAGPGGGRLNLREAVPLSVRSAALQAGTHRWRVEEAACRLRPVEDRPMLRWSGSGPGRSIDLAADFRLHEAVRIGNGDGLSARIGSLRLRGDAGWTPGAAPSLDARLEFRGGEMRHEEAGLVVEAIRGSMPITCNSNSAKKPGAESKAARTKQADGGDSAEPGQASEAGPSAQTEQPEQAAQTEQAEQPAQPEGSTQPEQAEPPDANGRSAEPPGAFRTGKIRLGDHAFPAVSGRVAIRDGEPRLSARWPVLESVTVQLTAEIRDGTPRVRARIPETELVDSRALARAFPVLEGLRIDGRFGLEAEAALRPDGMDPRIALRLDGLSIRSQAYEATASGITGMLTLTGLDPLRTPSSQTLRVEEATLGQIGLNGGRITFRVEDRRTVFIERMRWMVGDRGRFRVHAFDLDLADPRIRTDLFIEGMDLGYWLTALAGERVRATGRLFGRVPIAFRPDASQKLAFGRGYLYSLPGEEGTIRFRDPELAAKLLRQGRQRLEAGEKMRREMRQRIVEALTDFNYSTLAFRLRPQPEDGLSLRIRARGIGREGSRRIPIERLEVNVHNFGRLVNQAVFTRLRTDRAVDRALDRFFEMARP